jgi:hypothetical protein
MAACGFFSAINGNVAIQIARRGMIINAISSATSVNNAISSRGDRNGRMNDKTGVSG